MFLSLYGNFKHKVAEIHSGITQLWKEKREQDKRIQERSESVLCPYCGHRHSGSHYGKNATKADSIEFKDSRCGSRIDINFLECLSCNELFGVKTTYFYDPVSAIIRTGFCLIEGVKECQM